MLFGDSEIINNFALHIARRGPIWAKGVGYADIIKAFT